MIKLQAKKITVAEQVEQMRILQPNFHIRKKRRKRTKKVSTFKVSSFNKAVWIGDVRPTPLSRSYTIKIEYEYLSAPRVTVLGPKLKLAEGAKRLPHIYNSGDLCLYTPAKGEWHSGLSIASTIVPWISEWLYYYEIWLITGDWMGDDKDPFHEKSL